MAEDRQTVRVSGRDFTFSKTDVETAFAKTTPNDWENRGGYNPYLVLVVGAAEKPVKAVFRNMPEVSSEFNFNTHSAIRAFQRLGYRVRDTRGRKIHGELGIVGTWKGVMASVDDVLDCIRDRGGWASWWSFPIDANVQAELDTPFYLYLNDGGGFVPCRFKVEEYKTSKGNAGIESPWPGITNEAWQGKTKLSDKKSEIFKTWLKVKDVDKFETPLSISKDFFIAQPFSKSTNVLNQNRFGYVYEKFKEERVKVDLPINLILYGPPGTGKTHRLKSEYFKLFTEQQSEEKRYVFTTFHQSYSYEEFVEGIKPQVYQKVESAAGEIGYEIQAGVFKKVVQQACKHPEKRFALFIDEISRGNVASIFGELITLIEDDKREGAENELRATLPYSREEFCVPQNLHIIGTMNTADRSVVALDNALRRRFSFIEMMPEPNLIDQPAEFDVDLRQLLITINGRIERLLDRDHVIGHSYFMRVAEAAEPLKELQHVFANKVIPLLHEYFYGDPAKIGMVLGEGLVKIENNGMPFAKGNWDVDAWEDRPVYRFVSPHQLSTDDFKNIYAP